MTKTELLDELARLRRRNADLEAKVASFQAGEEKYRAMLEASADPIAVYDTRGAAAYVNPAFTRVFGWTLDEVAGKPIDFVPPDEAAKSMEAIRQIYAEEKTYHRLETRRYTKSGKILDISLNAAIFRGPDGAPAGMAVVFTDISERRRAEEALRQSEHLYRSILETSPVAISIFSQEDYRYLQVNPAFTLASGWSPEEALGKTPDELNIFTDPSERDALLERLRETGELDGFEARLRNRDGGVWEALISARPLKFQGRDCLLVVSQSVTELKRIQAELKWRRDQLEKMVEQRTREYRESEERYRSLFETAADAIFLSKDGRFFDCNAAALKKFGCTRDQIIGQPPARFSPPRQPDGSESSSQADYYIQLALEEGAQTFEWRHARLDGEPFETEVSLNRLELSGEVFLLAVVRDVTERKRTQEALRENEETFRRTLEAAPDAIAIARMSDAVFLDVNDYFTQMTGYAREEAVGKTSFELGLFTEPALRKKIMRMLKEKGAIDRLAVSFQVKGGKSMDALFSARLMRYRGEKAMVAVCTDVSELKRAEEALTQSESRLTKAQEVAHVGSWEMDLVNHREPPALMWASREALRIYGFPHQDSFSPPNRPYIPVRDVFEAIHPDDREADRKAFYDLIDNNAVYNVKRRIYRREDGALAWVRSIADLIRDQNGAPVKVVGTIQDITERLRTQEALRQSAAREAGRRELKAQAKRLQRILDGSPIGVGICRKSDQRILFSSKRLDRESGMGESSLVGSSAADLWSRPEQRREFAEHFERHGHVPSKPVRFRRRDGSQYWCLLTWQDIEYRDQACILFWVYDIDELKKAQQALEKARDQLEERVAQRTAELQRSRANFMRAFHGSPAWMCISAKDSGVFLEINDAYLNGLGWRRAEIVGKSSHEINMWPDRKARARWVEAIEKGALDGWAFTLRRRDGSFITVVSDVVTIEYDGEEVYLTTVRDITEKIKVEEEMTRLRNLLRSIIDSMPSVLVGVDPRGRVTQWNLEAEKTTGLGAQEVQGRPFNQVFPELDGEMDAIRQAISERKIHRDRKSSAAIDGETRFTDLTVYPLVGEEMAGAVIRIDDITDRVRLEEMVIQSEKMLSVGGLAAGMAHEINNPLAGMLQSAQVVLNRVTGDLPSSRRAAAECGVSLEGVRDFMEKRGIIKMLTNIQASGQRAANIVHNMLSFSRKEDASRLAPHDLAGLLDKTVNLASNDYDLKKKYDFRRIEIIRRYDPELPATPCEETKIQQVILNLLKNAAQAMAQDDHRAETARITLRTMREGDMARIEVEDNGPGMDEQTRKRVFEPFFTTKAVGMGAGLGLSVSYFIVTEHHQGRMKAESTPGRGAKFIILLPLSAGRRPDQPAPAGLAPRRAR